jgi:peptidoglycan/LPS O-acetylase OafA/YrhL
VTRIHETPEMSPSLHSTTSKLRFYLIDALRGIASFMVLLAHTLNNGITGAFGFVDQRIPPFWRWVHASLGEGVYWVWLFFILSGFCIHLSISRSLGNGTFNIRAYLLARFSRIYPLFLCGLAIAYLGWRYVPGYRAALDQPLAQCLSYSLAMMQGFLGYFPGFGASWSLSYEIVYYALWPLAVSLCRGSINRAIGVSAVACIFHTALWGYRWKTTGSVDNTLVHNLWNLSALYPLWLAGAWLAADVYKVGQWITRTVWMGSMLWIVVVYGIFSWMRHEHTAGWMQLCVAYLSVPGFALLIAGAQHATWLFNIRITAICQWLGAFSYPCYILHHPLHFIVEPYVNRYAPPVVLDSPVLRSIALLLPVLVVVIAIGIPLERYLLAWRKELILKH